MGGLAGYQLKSLTLILEANDAAAEAEAEAAAQAAVPSNGNGAAAAEAAAAGRLEDAQSHVTYHVPPGLDLTDPESGAAAGQRAAAQGLLALPFLAEVLPVGGAGDRLGLVCEATGQALPAAMLPYCGRPMLAGLLRDLAAREYLYWHLTGTQVGDARARRRRPAGSVHAAAQCLA